MLYRVTDTAALRHNARHIRRTAGVPLIAVLKHDAYGCGLLNCAAALETEVDAFAVETPDEARALRTGGTQKDIHILAPLDTATLSAPPKGVILPVDSLDIIPALGGIYMKEPVPVQLRADVDGSGLGLREEDVQTALRRIVGDGRFRLRGIFAHSPALYKRQETAAVAARFAALAQQVRAAVPDAVCHLAAGSAWQDERLRFGGVRAGTNLFGLPSYEGQNMQGLRPVLSLHTNLLRVFETQSLRFYDGCFDAKTPRRIGIAAAGYGHLPALIRARDLRVLVRGVSVPVLGSSAMGHMMVDLSAVPAARPRDEVVLVGHSGSETRTAHQFAAACGIPLCRCEGALFTANAIHEEGTRP